MASRLSSSTMALKFMNRGPPSAPASPAPSAAASASEAEPPAKRKKVDDGNQGEQQPGTRIVLEDSLLSFPLLSYGSAFDGAASAPSGRQSFGGFNPTIERLTNPDFRTPEELKAERLAQRKEAKKTRKEQDRLLTVTGRGAVVSGGSKSAPAPKKDTVEGFRKPQGFEGAVKGKGGQPSGKRKALEEEEEEEGEIGLSDDSEDSSDPGSDESASSDEEPVRPSGDKTLNVGGKKKQYGSGGGGKRQGDEGLSWKKEGERRDWDANKHGGGKKKQGGGGGFKKRKP